MSLGLRLTAPETRSVGRLVLDAEFRLGNRRGVVVHPKRGGVSDRYLQLLAAEGFDYVVIGGTPPFAIYGRTSGDALEPLRALPIDSPTQFPDAGAWDQLRLFLMERLGPGRIFEIASALLAAKLDDETAGNRVFTAAITRASTDTRVGLRAWGIDPELVQESEHAAVTTAAAWLSGYALTPRTAEQVAALLEVIAQVGGQKAWGLPARAAFAFSGDWTSGRRTVVVSSALGAQFLPLRATGSGEAFVALSAAQKNPLLIRLFPAVSFPTAKFLSWKPQIAPDRVIVVPPVGRLHSQSEHLEQSTAGAVAEKKSAYAEIAYIEHALSIAASDAVLAAVVPEGLLSGMSYAAFRTSLLRRVQLLAVLSLPRSSCFGGTAMRCSVLYLRKADVIPGDYPVAMIEATDEDTSSPNAVAAVRAAIDRAVCQRVSA